TAGREIARHPFLGVSSAWKGFNHDGTRVVRAFPKGVELLDAATLEKTGELSDVALKPPPKAVVDLDDFVFSRDGSRVIARRTIEEEEQLLVWTLARPTSPAVLVRRFVRPTLP